MPSSKQNSPSSGNLNYSYGSAGEGVSLQSHTFLKCRCFFVDEPSFLPLCHSVAKCSFESDFFI